MSEWISIAAIIIAIAAVGYSFYSKQTVVSGSNLSAAITAIPSLATEVDKAATIVVQSYEQARRKGQLENTPELNEVMNRVRGWLPEEIQDAVTNDQVVEAINSAILIASAMTNQINANKATVADSESGEQYRP